jgi:hypothetical protein
MRSRGEGGGGVASRLIGNECAEFRSRFKA